MEPVWYPDARAQETWLGRFMAELGFQDYEAFHRYSVEEAEAFYHAFFTRLGVPWRAPYTRVVEGHFPFPRFFVGEGSTWWRPACATTPPGPPSSTRRRTATSGASPTGRPAGRWKGSQGASGPSGWGGETGWGYGFPWASGRPWPSSPWPTSGGSPSPSSRATGRRPPPSASRTPRPSSSSSKTASFAGDAGWSSSPRPGRPGPWRGRKRWPWSAASASPGGGGGPRRPRRPPLAAGGDGEHGPLHAHLHLRDHGPPQGHGPLPRGLSLEGRPGPRPPL